MPTPELKTWWTKILAPSVDPFNFSHVPLPPFPIELLRFNTCGSVDDGKSTLIGRLLYDSKSLMEDQLEALEKSADITGGGQINLANLTDGLRAEREQGITIDVAYRYFATPRRNSSSPTRPAMCNTRATWSPAPARPTFPSCWWTRGTASSNKAAATPFIAALLGIPHLVIAINKMDLVGWSEERFQEIRDEFEGFLPKLDVFRDVKFIPISALNGDNVVDPPKTRPGIPARPCSRIWKPSTSPATGT
jgi:translation elongation factor EF-1alpha